MMRPLRPPTPAPANGRRERSEKRGESPVVIDEVDARAAVMEHNVRFVLGFGLAALIIIFAVILVFEFFHLQ
jgi:hypothetical protein